MAESPIRAQTLPPAGVATDLYSPPESFWATLSSVVCCNLGDAAARFSLALAISGADDDDKQYLYRDYHLPAGETFVATIGPTMVGLDVLRCKSDSGRVAFNAFGVEVG